MSDCFDHEADAYNDLLFGQSSKEQDWKELEDELESQTKRYHKPNKGYINISLQGEKNGYRGE